MKLYDKRDYFNLPIRIFHLYVSTFQKHLHMEYIYLSVDIYLSIPEHVAMPGFPSYGIAAD
jgi:hypothetical protein